MEQDNLQRIIKKGIFEGKRKRTRELLLFRGLIKPTKPEMIKSRRIHAVERTLSASNLDKIEKWDGETSRNIVNHLLELGYGVELKIWIADESRYKLDPERVEEVERIAREVCDKID